MRKAVVSCWPLSGKRGIASVSEAMSDDARRTMPDEVNL